jgi:hypothetical protein
VRVYDVLSSFKTKVRLRQGDTLSSILFNIFINGRTQTMEEEGDSGELVDLRIPVLLFADGNVLMPDGEE